VLVEAVALLNQTQAAQVADQVVAMLTQDKLVAQELLDKETLVAKLQQAHMTKQAVAVAAQALLAVMLLDQDQPEVLLVARAVLVLIGNLLELFTLVVVVAEQCVLALVVQEVLEVVVLAQGIH
jgi:hypothetical protein